MLTNAIFTGVIILELICSALVLFSIFRPEDRIWAPKEDRSPGRILMQFLFHLAGGGIITLGVLDWKARLTPVWVRGIGGCLWLGGAALAIWGVTVLGVQNTTGSPKELILLGPYRWTRNPQYLGFMLGLIGWGLLAASPFTLIAGMGGCIPLFLVPGLKSPGCWKDMERLMRIICNKFPASYLCCRTQAQIPSFVPFTT